VIDGNNDARDTVVVAPTPRRLVFSLALGTVGGAAFNIMLMPLPWMLGAMAFTAVAAMNGQPIAMSRPIRNIMIAVIGVLLGSAFNPTMAQQIGQWLTSLILLSFFLLFLALVVPRFLQWAGYDGATAYFSALPAGLTEMTIVGTEKGGNAQIIALTHTVRVLLIAFVIPFTMVILLGYERPTVTGPPLASLTIIDLALLLFSGLVGLWLGTRFSIPAGALAGPLALSAAIHFAGLTASSPPGVLVAAAQVVLGTSVGCRFAGLTIATSKRTIFLATIVTIVMLALSGSIAFGFGPLIGVDPMAFLLALSPGGVTEMSLMALALNQDTAFVTTHHVVRIALIVTIGPLFYTAFLQLRDKLDQASNSKKNPEL